uniref:Uncharacterized protein n=1 Tax=Rhizophora mucronata TaxID=61149 RepID=A0A2P2NXP9_RHIMU
MHMRMHTCLMFWRCYFESFYSSYNIFS